MKAIALPRMRREETHPSRPASSGDSEASEDSEHRTCVAREMLGSTLGRTCRSTCVVRVQ